MNKHQFFEQFYPSYEQHEAKMKALEAAWEELSSFSPQAHNTTRIGNYEIMLDDWSGKAPKGKSWEVDGKWYYDWEAAMSIQFPDGFRLTTTADLINICGLLDNNPSEIQNKLKLSLNGYHDGASVYGAGSRGAYWSSTFNGTSRAYSLYFDRSFVYPQYCMSKSYGLSVRCLKNNI